MRVQMHNVEGHSFTIPALAKFLGVHEDLLFSDGRKVSAWLFSVFFGLLF
jgi:hypothetical protein